MTDQFGPTADRGPDSDGSSSGSTTLSATSSPGGAGNGVASRIGDGNLSGRPNDTLFYNISLNCIMNTNHLINLYIQ